MTKDETILKLCCELVKCHSALVFINREVNLEMSYTKSAMASEYAIESIVKCLDDVLAENPVHLDDCPGKPKL